MLESVREFCCGMFVSKRVCINSVCFSVVCFRGIKDILMSSVFEVNKNVLLSSVYESVRVYYCRLFSSQ